MSVQKYVWGVAATIALVIWGAYGFISHQTSGGEWVLPLDDVYIHFQYACQMADGAWYQYNNGQPPTSGATSFAYPYFLALGCVAGLRGLALAFWATGLGAVALMVACVGVYRLARVYMPLLPAIAVMVVFALGGALAWHAMSGMETLIVVASALWVLVAFTEERWRVLMMTMTLLAMSRPEGGAMVGVVAVALLLQHQRFKLKERALWLLLPLSGLFIQPVVNGLVTGSWVATGNQSKSILATLPTDWEQIINRILVNWMQMWAEFLFGGGMNGVTYTPILLGTVALVGLGYALWQPKTRALAGIVLLWLLGVSIAVSTLDNAFWHFKRYHMPLIALFYPLAGWGLWALWRWRIVVLGYSVVVSISVPLLALAFAGYYAQNVAYVVAQPLAMARWLGANTPEDALIAVHDVGMMRYLGGRETLDMVGLTNHGLASYWRNGVGSVLEALRRYQPDYIASYGRGHGYGLAYLAGTRLYDAPLALFDVGDLSPTNVALAASVQGIYKPDWEAIGGSNAPLQASTHYYLGWLDDNPENDFALVTEVNVADIESELAVGYVWQSHYAQGFISEAYDFETVGCLQVCQVLDGGRLLNEGESFMVRLNLAQDALLVTRVHPQHAGTLAIEVNGTLVGTRTIPQMAGAWLELVTLIPRALLLENTVITLTPLTTEGYYMPYYHWVYQGTWQAPVPAHNAPLAVYGDAQVQLNALDIRQNEQALTLQFDWGVMQPVLGDYRVFVHVYDDVAMPPAVQYDGYTFYGGVSLGNWLVGVLSDTIVLDISGLPVGRYTLAVGFYASQTGERLQVVADDVRDNRALVGVIEVLADGR